MLAGFSAAAATLINIEYIFRVLRFRGNISRLLPTSP